MGSQQSTPEPKPKPGCAMPSDAPSTTFVHPVFVSIRGPLPVPFVHSKTNRILGDPGQALQYRTSDVCKEFPAILLLPRTNKTDPLHCIAVVATSNLPKWVHDYITTTLDKTSWDDLAIWDANMKFDTADPFNSVGIAAIQWWQMHELNQFDWWAVKSNARKQWHRLNQSERGVVALAHGAHAQTNYNVADADGDEAPTASGSSRGRKLSMKQKLGAGAALAATLGAGAAVVYSQRKRISKLWRKVDSQAGFVGDVSNSVSGSLARVEMLLSQTPDFPGKDEVLKDLRYGRRELAQVLQASGDIQSASKRAKEEEEKETEKPRKTTTQG